MPGKTEWPRKRWDRIYNRHFPHDTDSTSRWVQMMATDWFRRKGHPLRELMDDYDDADRVADALERTVIMLWEARQRIRELEARQ